MDNQKRIGFIGIIIEDLTKSSEVNRIIGSHSDMIRGRIGIPDHENRAGVIALIISGTNDEIGGLSGKLGSITGVQCRSLLAKPLLNDSADKKL